MRRADCGYEFTITNMMNIGLSSGSVGARRIKIYVVGVFVE